MDDSQKQARGDATAMVSREFEPVRIERQLLVRAFDLVYEQDMQSIGASHHVAKQPTDDGEGRHAA